jgi:hypothetical protein
MSEGRAGAAGHLGKEDCEKLLELIEEMRGTGSYEWAESTLTGIYDYIHTNAFVTEAQKASIRKIGEARRRTWEEDLEDGRGLV